MIFFYWFSSYAFHVFRFHWLLFRWFLLILCFADAFQLPWWRCHYVTFWCYFSPLLPAAAFAASLLRSLISDDAFAMYAFRFCRHLFLLRFRYLCRWFSLHFTMMLSFIFRWCFAFDDTADRLFRWLFHCCRRWLPVFIFAFTLSSIFYRRWAVISLFDAGFHFAALISAFRRCRFLFAMPFFSLPLRHAFLFAADAFLLSLIWFFFFLLRYVSLLLFDYAIFIAACFIIFDAFAHYWYADFIFFSLFIFFYYAIDFRYFIYAIIFRRFHFRFWRFRFDYFAYFFAFFDYAFHCYWFFFISLFSRRFHFAFRHIFFIIIYFIIAHWYFCLIFCRWFIFAFFSSFSLYFSLPFSPLSRCFAFAAEAISPSLFSFRCSLFDTRFAIILRHIFFLFCLLLSFCGYFFLRHFFLADYFYFAAAALLILILMLIFSWQLMLFRHFVFRLFIFDLFLRCCWWYWCHADGWLLLMLLIIITLMLIWLPFFICHFLFAYYAWHCHYYFDAEALPLIFAIAFADYAIIITLMSFSLRWYCRFDIFFRLSLIFSAFCAFILHSLIAFRFFIISLFFIFSHFFRHCRYCSILLIFSPFFSLIIAAFSFITLSLPPLFATMIAIIMPLIAAYYALFSPPADADLLIPRCFSAISIISPDAFSIFFRCFFSLIFRFSFHAFHISPFLFDYFRRHFSPMLIFHYSFCYFADFQMPFFAAEYYAYWLLCYFRLFSLAFLSICFLHYFFSSFAIWFSIFFFIAFHFLHCCWFSPIIYYFIIFWLFIAFLMPLLLCFDIAFRFTPLWFSLPLFFFLSSRLMLFCRFSRRCLFSFAYHFIVFSFATMPCWCHYYFRHFAYYAILLSLLLIFLIGFLRLLLFFFSSFFIFFCAIYWYAAFMLLISYVDYISLLWYFFRLLLPLMPHADTLSFFAAFFAFHYWFFFFSHAIDFQRHYAIFRFRWYWRFRWYYAILRFIDAISFFIFAIDFLPLLLLITPIFFIHAITLFIDYGCHYWLMPFSFTLLIFSFHFWLIAPMPFLITIFFSPFHFIAVDFITLSCLPLFSRLIFSLHYCRFDIAFFLRFRCFRFAAITRCLCHYACRFFAFADAWFFMMSLLFSIVTPLLLFRRRFCWLRFWLCWCFAAFTRFHFSIFAAFLRLILRHCHAASGFRFHYTPLCWCSLLLLRYFDADYAIFIILFSPCRCRRLCSIYFLLPPSLIFFAVYAALRFRHFFCFFRHFDAMLRFLARQAPFAYCISLPADVYAYAFFHAC